MKYEANKLSRWPPKKVRHELPPVIRDCASPLSKRARGFSVMRDRCADDIAR